MFVGSADPSSPRPVTFKSDGPFACRDPLSVVLKFLRFYLPTASVGSAGWRHGDVWSSRLTIPGVTGRPTGISHFARLRAAVRALRPRQWVKNLLVCLGAAGSGTLLGEGVLSRLLLLVVCFSLLASAVYLCNDVLDREFDRLDPRTSSRPVAAGLLTPTAALLLAGVLALMGLLGVFALGRAVAFVLVLYTLNTLLYSWRLKHVPVLEVALVASGFVARAVAGALAVDAPLSGWFLPLVATVAVFVVLVKRSGELMEGRSPRPVLSFYSAPWLRRARRAALLVAIGLFAGWAVSAPVLAPAVVCLVLLACALVRVEAAVSMGRASAPDELVFRDLLLFVLALGWFVSFLLAVG